MRLQVGIGEDGSILTHIGGKLGTGGVGSGQQANSDSLYTNSVTYGDVNGDGILDLVTGGATTGFLSSVTIQLGTGNGNFAAATSFIGDPLSRIRAVALGDVNGDGILDLASAGYNNTEEFTNIRLGAGNGSFGAITTYLAGISYGTSLALADLNGDGNLDLITGGATATDGYATIRLGAGNGSFGAATSFTTEAGFTRSLVLGDLNGDGILDLVTGGNNDGNRGYATVRLGTGNGGFGAATSLAESSFYVTSVMLGDLNGDGILDLFTAGSGYTPSYSGYANIRLGTGTGSFGAARSYTMEDGISTSLALGDLNGDGFLDLVTAGQNDTTDGYGTIRLGGGNGTFGSASSFQTESKISNSIVLADLDGDGVTDIITGGQSDSNNGNITVKLGSTRDGISPLQPFTLKTKASALQSISVFTNNLNNLSSLRGTIGANQSRLDVASANLVSMRENFIAASTRTTDADIAQDAANLIRTQILQQAATSILAQANQAPALALILLRQ